jgi:drug/metabolite transporter (DMT)-like permease
MPSAAGPILLLLLTAFAWSGVDLARKVLVREIPPAPLVVWLTLGALPFFGAWMVWEGAGAPAAGYLAPAAASVALNVVANLCFLEGLRIAPLSVTVPMLSLTPVFVALLAIPMLGERPSARAAVGIALVIAGALWLHGAAPRGRAGWSQEERAARLRGGALVAATALFWALTIPLDKLAVARAAPSLHGFVLNAGVAVGVLGLLMARGQGRALATARRAPWALLLGLTVSALALGLQLVALPLVHVGALETVKRGVGNFMAVAVGAAAFGEALTGHKLLAVGMMALGVGLVMS